MGAKEEGFFGGATPSKGPFGSVCSPARSNTRLPAAGRTSLAGDVGKANRAGALGQGRCSLPPAIPGSLLSATIGGLRVLNQPFLFCRLLAFGSFLPAFSQPVLAWPELGVQALAWLWRREEGSLGSPHLAPPACRSSPK